IRTNTPNVYVRPYVRPAAPEAHGQAPAPVLRPAREGLPPSRTIPPTVVAQPERRRPSAPVTAPAPAPAPAPTPTPHAAPAADQPRDRPDRGPRPAPPAQQPTRAPRPAPPAP